MQVTIILVSYNSGNYIENCLNSVIQMTESLSYDITVVDNASRDNTVSLIRLKFPGIKLIENKINYGFAKAVNQAVKGSISDYVLLLNPDTLLLNNAVKIFYDYFQKSDNQNVACAGGAKIGRAHV
jgi:GT2 family glycosyltransferase